MRIFSIKNEKMEYFNKPTFAESANEALSLCQNILMSDADRVMLGLKDDLALYHHGEVDFVTGCYDMLKKPSKICDLRELFESIPEDKIPRTERQLLKLIEGLGERIKAIEESEVFSDALEMHGDEESALSV